MKITGLGILAEMICCLLEEEKINPAKAKYDILLERTKDLIEKDLPDETKAMLVQMKELEEEALVNNNLNKKKLYQLSRMITY